MPSDFEYRRPEETVAATLAALRQAWDALDPVSRITLNAALAAGRSQLYTASNDMGRAQAAVALLAALETTPGLPAAAAATLSASHQPRTRSIPMLTEQDARQLVQTIDALAVPGFFGFSGPAPRPSQEVFPDAAKTARAVIGRLNRDWATLSLAAQDRGRQHLIDYHSALFDAATDHERIEATQEFLRRVKADRDLYAVAEAAYTHRSQPVFGPGGLLAFSANDASQLRDLILDNPGLAIANAPLTTAIDEPFFTPALTQPALTPVIAAGGHSLPLVAPVDYHSDVRCPGEVSIFEQDVPLRVRLTLQKSADTVLDTSVAVAFDTPEPQALQVICHAPGFTVDDQTSQATRTILVYPGRDSQWAVFLLTPLPTAGPGMRRITLDFYHRERPVGTGSFEMEVRDRPPVKSERPLLPAALVGDAGDTRGESNLLSEIVFASPAAVKADFVLRIALDASATLLSYTLHSPTGKLGLVHEPVGSVTLQMDARTYLENTLLSLSQMARGKKKPSAVEVEANLQRLREIGWGLYEDLFPPQLRQRYRQISQLQQPAGSLSLLIVSDEPWIPWEMVLPHEDDLPNEDFLCATFKLARWLDGASMPERVALRRAEVIVPKSDLNSVKVEQSYFRNTVPKTYPKLDISATWLGKLSEVKAALQGGQTQLFHFACHGGFDATRPDDSVLELTDGDLTPSQIVGPLRTGIHTSRPVVFLNACHSAEASFSLTRIGGWAARFVRAGVTAFIGSLWEVNDDLAARFAVEFYTHWLAGKPFAEAGSLARAAIRAANPSNPTWLAYTLYGDPHGEAS